MIEAKSKALRVISKCETHTQLEGAQRYAEFYFEKFEDFLGKQELDLEVSKKFCKLSDNIIAVRR